MRGIASLALAIGLVGCADSAAAKSADAAGSDAAAALPCNGSVALCSKPMNQVVFPTAHNAMSNAAEKWLLPNQPDGLRAQLDAGITGLMIDVHPAEDVDGVANGTALLCHGLCALGHRDLAEAFADINAWLTDHPRTVLVVVIEDYVDESLIENALAKAWMLSRCVVHRNGGPWPTLQTLIAADRRVLIMLESGKGVLPWNHPYEKFAFDTPYEAEKPADFSCDVLRGKAGNDFFVVNHFLTHLLDSHAELAKLANHNPLLIDRVAQCEKKQGHRANLIAVDWYGEGDVLAVAAALNAAATFSSAP